jgi:hypothetical protein
LGSVFAAKMIVEPVENLLVVWCPFDVDLMIDADGDEVQWSTINIDLLSWLMLKWYAYGDTINIWFPIMSNWNNLIAYWFKFPGVFTGLVKFATLRLQQNDKINKNSLHFNRNQKVWDSTDFMDVHLLGWKDHLQWIENKEFIFADGNCPGLSILSWDQLSPNFDQKAHLMWLYQTIDDFLLQKNKSGLWNRITSNIYYSLSFLLLLIIIISLIILYRRRKIK